MCKYQRIQIDYILPGVAGLTGDQRDTVQTRGRYRRGETPDQLGARMRRRLVAHGRTAGGRIVATRVSPWTIAS